MAEGDERSASEMASELADRFASAMRNELTRLRAENAELRTALDEARADLARSKAERDPDRAQLAAKDTLIVELRRELEHHRRPWWRRLIG